MSARQPLPRRPVGSARMRAAVQRSIPGIPEVVEVSIDQPGPREVLIQTVAAGLCRSDLSFIRVCFPAMPRPRSWPDTRAPVSSSPPGNQ